MMMLLHTKIEEARDEGGRADEIKKSPKNSAAVYETKSKKEQPGTDLCKLINGILGLHHHADRHQATAAACFGNAAFIISAASGEQVVDVSADYLHL